VIITFTLSASAREEIRAKSAAHDLVKLLDDKLMSIDLLDFSLSLADSSCTTEPRGVSLHTNRVLDYFK
jgi:hypothetical protein